MDLRKNLSFCFEQTFTIPSWWTDPGFVSTSDTPLKREKMKQLAEAIASVTGGTYRESLDIYKHLQYETFDTNGASSFVVTMDPGSIEVKTPPLLIESVVNAMKPLFDAAERAELVTYRSWWYGIKTGTEGGCHVNMAGMTAETNPWIKDPDLVLKYAAFFHNNPWIHYPFMGVDVGPGGNCMRMDEFSAAPGEKGSPDSVTRFKKLAEAVNAGRKISVQEISEELKGCTLIEDKHSAPSFYKMKEPLFFIEDRAVEALRSAEEFGLIAELRLKILEHLQRTPKIGNLHHFGPDLHIKMLNSIVLWEKFQEMARALGMDPSPYRVFFDRQFPILSGGENVPLKLELREGRRPRVITGIQTRGELVISKTIDTRFKRFEFIWEGDTELWLNGKKLRPGKLSRDEKPVNCAIVDCIKSHDKAAFEIRLCQPNGGPVLENALFSIHDMLFRQLTDTSNAPASEEVSKPDWLGEFYFNLENDPLFA